MITLIRLFIVSAAVYSFYVSLKIFENQWEGTTAWIISIVMTIAGVMLTGVFIEKNRSIVASIILTNGAFACLGLYLLSYGEGYQQFIMILGYVFIIPTGITVFYMKQNIKNRKRVLQRTEKEERTLLDVFSNLEEKKEVFKAYKKDFGFWVALKVAMIGEGEELDNSLDFDIGKVVEIDEDYREV